MPQAVFNAWAILGDRVIQPGDFATAFSARWSEMRRFVQGIHSDQVLAAIDNFGKITGAPPGRYFWNQRITLRAFLEKHLEKFLPANFREEDFLARTAQRPAPPGKVDDEKTRAAKRRIYGTEGI